MGESRKNKSVINVMTGIGGKIITLLFAFVTRTMFIRMLGADYAGVSSLYTNVLSVLSLAELGLGNVFIYFLYSALKNNNKFEIVSYIREFRKLYLRIATMVLIVGISLIPMLSITIKSNLGKSELILYYILYLMGTVTSYLFVYKTMILQADQNVYISNICSTIFNLLMYICQMIWLYIWGSFIGYLCIQIICPIINNYVQSIIAKKKYPYLSEDKYYDEGLVDKKQLLSNIKATFLFKVSDTILDQTDSIIISIMFGTVIVGYYSNYYMIISYLVILISLVVNGIIASVGNLNAEGNLVYSYKIFRVTMLLFAILASICSTSYICIIQDFIPIWIGNKFLISYDVVISIIVVFYLRISTNTVWIYRMTMGLFKEVQYIMVMAAILNIMFSICLGKQIGISGVIVATAISRLLTSFWYEGILICKKLNVNSSVYFILQLKNLFYTFLTMIISIWLCCYIRVENIIGIILKIVIVIFVSLFLSTILYCRTEEFQYLVHTIENFIGSLKKHTSNSN